MISTSPTCPLMLPPRFGGMTVVTGVGVDVAVGDTLVPVAVAVGVLVTPG